MQNDANIFAAYSIRTVATFRIITTERVAIYSFHILSMSLSLGWGDDLRFKLNIVRTEMIKEGKDRELEINVLFLPHSVNQLLHLGEI